MADKQIHELTAIERAPVNADVIALDTGSVTGKMAYSTFKTAINADALSAVDALETEVETLQSTVETYGEHDAAVEERLMSLDDTVGSFYPVFTVGAISGTSGNDQNTNTARAKSDFIPVALYDRIFAVDTNFMFYVYCYDANKAFIATYSSQWYTNYMKLTNLTLTVAGVEKVCKYIRVVLCKNNGSGGTDNTYVFTDNIPVMPIRVERMDRIYQTVNVLDATALKSSAMLCGNRIIPWSGDGYVSIPASGGAVSVPVPDVLQDKQNYKYSLVECEQFDEFEIMGVTTVGAARAWAFLDSAGVVLTRAGVDGRTTYTLQKAPLGAKYLLINQLDTTLPSYYGAFVSERLEEASAKAETTNADTSGYEVLPFTGYGLVPEGDITIGDGETIFQAAAALVKGDANRKYTFIQCERGATYTISGSGGGSSTIGYFWRSWCLYDSTGTVIRKGARASVQNTQITVPDMECYLLINSRYGWQSYKGWMDKAAIPDYYFDLVSGTPYLQERVSTVQGHMNDMGVSGATIAFVTDMHAFSVFVNGSIASPNNGLRAVKLLKYMQDKANVGMIFNGGDLFSGASDENQDEGGETVTFYPSETSIKRTFAEGRNYLAPVWEDMYYVLGNHEWDVVGTDSIPLVQRGLMYGMFIGDKANRYGGQSVNGDYYVDDAAHKIRYFCIHAGDGALNVGLSSQTIQWFAGQMQALPAGFLAVVISHLAINGSGTVYLAFQPIVDILEKAKAKETYTYTVGGEPILYDYTNFVGQVGFVLCGHVHVDVSTYSSAQNIPLIATTCDRVPKNMDSKSVIGTVNEGAFDVVQIDRANNKVYFTRIGRSLLANPDREFDF